MEISDLTLRLMLLFFPGLICCKLVDNLTIHKERTTAMFIVHSFILGISCYLLLYVLAWLLMEASYLVQRPLVVELVFFQALTDRNTDPQWTEILIAGGLSFPLAFGVSWFTEKKLIHRLAQRIHVTSKFGDLDVWDFMFNAPNIQWVVVRDIKNDLVFEGWVEAFSDIADIRELLLRDVRVYRNSTGEHLYEVGGLYFSRKKEDITIELADLGYKNPPNKEENQEEHTVWQTIRKLIGEFRKGM